MKLWHFFHSAVSKQGLRKKLSIDSTDTEGSLSLYLSGPDTGGDAAKVQKKPRKKPRKKSYRNCPANTSGTVEEVQSPNEKMIASLIAHWNMHAPPEDCISFFTSEKDLFRFEDAPPVNVREWVGEFERMTRSFPDVQFGYDSIKETRPGEVIVEDWQCTATHTGAPYSFGPFPPIPRTNRRCINDLERLYFTIENGKVSEVTVIALGSLSGIVGLYIQIGGKLEI